MQFIDQALDAGTGRRRDLELIGARRGRRRGKIDLVVNNQEWQIRRQLGNQAPVFCRHALARIDDEQRKFRLRQRQSRASHAFAFDGVAALAQSRSEEHTSELQSLMRTSYAVFCLKQTKSETTQ